MANRCFTTYKIIGYKPALESLVKALEEIKPDNSDIYLSDLAKHYNIDYEKECISVRGWIDYWQYDDDVLTIETDTAWSGCHELFHEINKKLKDKLSISYREEESGFDIFYIHDERDFFPEECMIDYGIYKDGKSYSDVEYLSISEAVNKWCEIMEVQQVRTDEEMVKLINEYEYENEGSFFYIHKFDRE